MLPDPHETTVTSHMVRHDVGSSNSHGVHNSRTISNGVEEQLEGIECVLNTLNSDRARVSFAMRRIRVILGYE